MIFGDFDGDGRSDRITLLPGGGIGISRSDGVRFTDSVSWFGAALPPLATLFAGDFNGDGKSDLMTVTVGGIASVLLSDGSRFNLATEWSVGGLINGPVLVGDFNGDGKSDLMVARADENGLDVILSTESGFAAPVDWSSSIDTSGFPNWRVGDFNGDGKDDLLSSGTNGVDVILSTEAGVTLSPEWTAAGLGSGSWIVGDFNGDGKSDAYRYLPYQLDSDVFLSNGWGLHAGGLWSAISALSPTNATSIDFNGDGLADIAISDSFILLNTGAGFSAYFTDRAPGAPIPEAVKIPPVVIEGDAFTLNVDRADAYSCTIYDPSTGEVLMYIPSLSETTRIELGEGFDPGKSYDIRLNGIGDSIAYTSTFKVISEEAANEALHLLDRFNMTIASNEAAQYFANDDWKAGVHSFQELSDYFVSLFEQNHPSDGAAGSDTAKALFIMQCVNQMWAYGNETEPTLLGRVIQNELFSIQSMEDISFDLYLNSPIGDCQDFAALTAFILTREGLENRIVLTTGHVFNEVLVDGEWITIDSTYGISYDRPYAEVLDTSNTVGVIDFGRASSVYGSDLYRDLAGDTFNNKIYFDAAGMSSDPQILSVTDFYQYILDGFIYVQGLDGQAPTEPVDRISIPNAYSGQEIDFTDFYYYLAHFDRFDVSYLNEEQRDAPALASDVYGLLHALEAERPHAGNAGTVATTLDSVLASIASARSLWAVGDQGAEGGAATDFISALGLEYSGRGFRVSLIEAKDVKFLELRTTAGEAFVIDTALGIVYVGAFSHLLIATKVQAVVLPRWGDWAATSASWTEAMNTNLLKFQLGYYADFKVTGLSEWLFSLAGVGAGGKVEGGATNDILHAGGVGAYVFDVAGGDDTLIGGASNDRLEVGRQDGAGSIVSISGQAGDDVIRFNGFGRSLDTVQTAGGDGADSIEVLHARSADIDGGDGDDTIYVVSAAESETLVKGGAGADRLYLSFAGRATVDAGDGDDVIYLSYGVALVSVTLGAGADRLVLSGRLGQVNLARGPALVIQDFAAGNGGDVLDLADMLTQLFPQLGSDDPFATGCIRILQVGSATHLQIRLGSGDYATLVTLENTSVDALVGYNFAGLILGMEAVGHAGADDLSGSGFADMLSGLEGDDILKGEGGNDALYGGDGDDKLYGGLGADTLEGGSGADYLDGQEGADVLLGQDGGDSLIGRDGDDYANGGSGNDYASGGSGADTLMGEDGDDQLFGDAGDDAIHGGAGKDWIDGGEGNDILDGGDDDDTLLGRAGDDVASGGRGNDYLHGGAGADTLVGGEGLDQLFGDTGDDTLQGDAGNDWLDGGDGNDILDGGDDDDNLFGGAGDDHLTGGAGRDYLSGGAGADILIGVDGDDQLFGDADDDTLQGGSGRDTLDGGSGDDNLQGGDDDDILISGVGNDALDGGSGVDVAQFRHARSLATISYDNGVIIVEGPEGRSRLVNVEMLTFTDGVYDVRADGLVASSPRQTLVGAVGADDLTGGDSVDSLFGGEGDDRLYGGMDGDTLDGGAGADQLDGQEGDDVLIGRDGNDILIGRAGNDYVNAGAGDDYVNAGDGADVVVGEAGDDQLFGEAGNDNLQGGSGKDRLDGGDGDDTLSGGDDDDILLGRAGDDYASGGSGNDYIHGGAGADILVGDDGDDQLIGDDGDDNLQGGAGKDWIEGGLGDDILQGGDGDDVLTGSAGDDNINGGAEVDTAQFAYDRNLATITYDAGAIIVVGPEGRDRLIDVEVLRFSDGFYDVRVDGRVADTPRLSILAGAAADVVSGGDSADVLYGGDGDDQISGGEGADLLDGQDGNDLLAGGEGSDTLIGRAGDDQASGGSGNDYLNGGDGADVLRGDDGDDQMFGEAGVDDLQGGCGKDWLDGGEGDDTLDGGDDDDIVLGRDGDDHILGGNGNDYLNGCAGADVLVGDQGDDQMFGDVGDDNLQGGVGSDSLNGGDGADTLNGGDDNDTLFGGAGDDYLIGGGGSDLFIVQAGGGFDTIEGFSGAGADHDRIQIAGLGWETFDDLMAHTQQVGNHVVISFSDGGSLTLTDVVLTDLVAADFDIWR